jgi:hypothetical protein
MEGHHNPAMIRYIGGQQIVANLVFETPSSGGCAEKAAINPTGITLGIWWQEWSKSIHHMAQETVFSHPSGLHIFDRAEPAVLPSTLSEACLPSCIE